MFVLLVYYVFWGWNNIYCFNNYIISMAGSEDKGGIEEVRELGKKSPQSYADPLQDAGSVKMRGEATG